MTCSPILEGHYMIYGNIGLITYALFAGGGTPPIQNDWSEWNGSGDMPFTSQGNAYLSNQASTISCAKIDANRFLLIANGYTDNNTSEYIPATVTVATLTGAQPTYGTPVTLDAEADNVMWYRSAYVSDGKVYIYYTWYDGLEQVSYAKICNIDISGNITFGARSTNIGPASPSTSATPYDLAYDATLAPSIPYHVYRDSSLGHVWIIATTINNDDTITVGTPVDFGNTQIALLQLKVLASNSLCLCNTQIVYVISVTGTTIGSIAAQVTISGSIISAVIAVLSPTKILYFYSTNLMLARIITYDGASTLTPQAPTTIASNTNGNGIIQEALNINNNGNQVIVTWVIADNPFYFGNVVAACITPDGNTVSSATPVAINADPFDVNAFIVLYVQSAVISQTLIASPYPGYNDVDYGVTLLNLENAFTLPQLIYRLQAGLRLETQLLSLVNGIGIAGATTLTIAGNVTSTFVKGIVFLEGTDATRSHVVISSSFGGGVTTVTFSTPLVGTLSGTPLTFYGVYIWQASSGFYDDINFSNDIDGEKLYVGQLNGQPTIIGVTTEESAYLTSDSIATDDATFPSSVLATDFTLFMVCNPVSGTFFDITNDAKIYPVLRMTSDGSDIATDIYPTSESPVELIFGGPLDLAVITIVRRNGASSAYINHGLQANATNIVLAMGSTQVHYLFSNFNNVAPALGAISDIQYWEGNMGNTQRSAIISDLMTQYSIS